MSSNLISPLASRRWFILLRVAFSTHTMAKTWVFFQQLIQSCDTLRPAVQSRQSYSLNQLEALDEYTRSMSWYCVLFICIMMVAPSTLLIFMFNLIPLQAPSSEMQQNASFFIRTNLGAAVGSVGVGMQIYAGVSDAGLTPYKIVIIAFVSSVGYAGIITLLARFWVFPVPWIISFGSLPFVWLFASDLYLSIGRERFRTKPQLKKDLRRAISVPSRQVVLLLIYPSFNAVHIRLSRLSQLAFLLVLPIMKFVMKRLVSRAAATTGEGTSNEIVLVMITNVDVFDALFISKCMHNSASFWTGVGLIVIDVVESAHHISHLHKLAQRCELSQSECLLDSMKRTASVTVLLAPVGKVPSSSIQPSAAPRRADL